MKCLLDALMVVGPVPDLVQPSVVFSDMFQDRFEQRPHFTEDAQCQAMLKKYCILQGGFGSFSSMVF